METDAKDLDNINMKNNHSLQRNFFLSQLYSYSRLWYLKTSRSYTVTLSANGFLSKMN